MDRLIRLARSSSSLEDWPKPKPLHALLATADKPQRSELLRALNSKYAPIQDAHKACLVLNACWDFEELPTAALELVSKVHDDLYELQGPALHAAMEVCERWVVEARNGMDRVAPQLVVLAVAQSLESEEAPARVFNVREAIKLFDLQDESSKPLIDLLQKAFLTPCYLNSKLGRKMLAFVMTLNYDIMMDSHETIKTQLVALRASKSDRKSSTISSFARVYYGAWQILRKEKEKRTAAASNNTPAAAVNLDNDEWVERERLLLAFEKSIVQTDFMYRAVFAKDENLCKTYLKILNAAFHENKKDRSVDSMLAKRYDPIIWAGLSAVNSSVRRNAAVVFFNAFPLNDTEAKIEEVSKSIQRQFNAVQTLLMDPCPEVRVTAVEGACRVMALYWDTIPANKSSKYLQLVVNDLANDKSSPAVRCAVLRGLSYMLDFPLTQGALKIALKHVGNLLDDRARSVRVEMAKLLLKIDSTNGLKFGDFVPVQSVLKRLVEDADSAPDVCAPLCSILVESFFPVEAESVEQLKRAKSLASTSYEASQVFFKNLYRFVDINKVAKLALLFGSFARARRQEVAMGMNENHEYQDEDDEIKAAEEVSMAFQSAATLFESIHVLVFEDERHAHAKQSLCETFSHDDFLLPFCEWNAFYSRYESPLMRLAALVPCPVGLETTKLERKFVRDVFLAKAEVSKEFVDRRVDLILKWKKQQVLLKESLRSLGAWFADWSDLSNDNDVVKRRVNASIACRVVNRLAISSSNEELVELQNDPILSELFIQAKQMISHVANTSREGRADVVVSMALIELKIDVHLNPVASTKLPFSICSAVEWIANEVVPSLKRGFENVAAASRGGGGGGGGKKKKAIAVEETVEEMERLSFELEEIALSSPAHRFISCILCLLADCANCGMDTAEPTQKLINAFIEHHLVTKFYAFGLNRLLIQNLREYPDQFINSENLVRAYEETKDDESIAVTFARHPEVVFNNVILALHQRNYNSVLRTKKSAVHAAFLFALETVAGRQARNLHVDEDVLQALETFATESPKRDVVRAKLINFIEGCVSEVFAERIMSLVERVDAASVTLV